MLKPKDLTERTNYLNQKYANKKLRLTDINRKIIREILKYSKNIINNKELNNKVEDPLYCSLHNSNKLFHKSFVKLAAKTNREIEYKKIFPDVISQYQLKNYRIPHLSLKHNIFNPSVLLMDQNETELHYKYNISDTDTQKILKDKSKSYMNKVYSIVNAYKFYHSTRSEKIIKEIHHNEDYYSDMNQNNVYLETSSNRGSRNKKSGLQEVDLHTERRRLISEIKATTMSINNCEAVKKTPELVIIPKLVLTQSKNRLRSPKANKTLSTFYNSTGYSHSSRKQKSKIHTHSELKENLIKKNKTIVNKNNNTPSPSPSKNAIIRYHSHSTLPYNHSITHELNSKEDFLNFFSSLRDCDINKYNFQEIAHCYCRKCLSKEHRREFEKIFIKESNPKHLLCIIRKFQKIVSKYNVSSNYPNKIITKPAVTTEGQIDEYTKTYDKQFKKKYFERQLSK